MDPARPPSLQAGILQQRGADRDPPAGGKIATEKENHDRECHHSPVKLLLNVIRVQTGAGVEGGQKSLKRKGNTDRAGLTRKISQKLELFPRPNKDIRAIILPFIGPFFIDRTTTNARYFLPNQNKTGKGKQKRPGTLQQPGANARELLHKRAYKGLSPTGHRVLNSPLQGALNRSKRAFISVF